MKLLSILTIALTISLNAHAIDDADLYVKGNGNKLILTAVVSDSDWTMVAPTLCSRIKKIAKTMIKNECFVKGYKSCKKSSTITNRKTSYDGVKYCTVRMTYEAEM